jgi:hypothetical protein
MIRDYEQYGNNDLPHESIDKIIPSMFEEFEISEFKVNSPREIQTKSNYSTLRGLKAEISYGKSSDIK